MKNLFTRAHFALLLVAMAAIVHPCRASPTPVVTTPHVFPLHFVSWLNNGPIIPGISLKADFVAYPNSSSYKEFLDAPENSPERTVSRYIQTLAGENDTLTPEALSTIKGLYAEEERRDSEDVIAKIITSQFRHLKPDASHLCLWHRYDAGSLTIISLATVSPTRVQPFRACLHKDLGFL